MKTIVKWLIGVVALVGFSASVFGQVDNKINPFTDPLDSGGAEQVGLIGTEKGQEDSIANVVKWFVNWTLGILALIALIVVLRGWFQMVLAAGDEEKYNNGFKILKQAAIGLVVIGLAWFIVSLIFYVLNIVAVGAEDTGWNTIE